MRVAVLVSGSGTNLQSIIDARLDSFEIACILSDRSGVRRSVRPFRCPRFREGIDVLAEAGAMALVEPGGSKGDDDVAGPARKHGMTLIFTGHRRFQH